MTAAPTCCTGLSVRQAALRAVKSNRRDITCLDRSISASEIPMSDCERTSRCCFRKNFEWLRNQHARLRELSLSLLFCCRASFLSLCISACIAVCSFWQAVFAQPVAPQGLALNSCATSYGRFALRADLIFIKRITVLIVRGAFVM